ncbi:hypothetical protein [Croceibacterium aestuarii]|uniref:hypothetical protein n=1 Tax=Croceibacterium aestuarii TaxID=3064139 RepID=UPI00272E9E53|nr:hypothetical protein [Croceibacterium sp. D39]
MNSQFVFILALVILASAVAYRRGGPPERFAALVIVAWVGSDAVYHLLFGFGTFARVDPVHVVFDVSELAAVVWLALRANRVWPIVAAAAQVMCVSGHIAVLVEPDGARRAYWAMTSLPQYIQLAALVAGAAAHQKRLRLIGRYRSWRYSWT